MQLVGRLLSRLKHTQHSKDSLAMKRGNMYNNALDTLTHIILRIEIMSKSKPFLKNYDEMMRAVTSGESAVGVSYGSHNELPLASQLRRPACTLHNIPKWKNALFLITQVYPVLLAHSYAGTVTQIRTVHEFDNKALSIFLLLCGVVPYILYVAMPLYMGIPGVQKWLLKPRVVKHHQACCLWSV